MTENVLVKLTFNLVVLVCQCIVMNVISQLKANLFKVGFVQIAVDH